MRMGQVKIGYPIFGTKRNPAREDSDLPGIELVQAVQASEVEVTMPNQPAPSNSLLDKLGTLQSNWGEIEAFLKQLVPALGKVGFKLSIDPLALLQRTTRSMTETTQQAKLISDQLKQLQDLINESALITSSLELDQVLERVIDTVITLTGAGRAYLMLRDPNSDELTVRTARNWDKEQLTADSIGYSRSVVETAIRQESPVLTTNAQVDERFSTAASVADMSLLMILCIPLIVQGQVMGVLYADSKVERGLFREDQVPLLSAFATQAAIAIKNAHEFGQVKENLKEALREVQELRIQIDYERMAKDVTEITESEYFQHLVTRVGELRSRFKAKS